MLTILVTPLISAALIALFLRRQGNLAAGVSVAAAGILCVLSLQLIFGNGAESIAYKWLEIDPSVLTWAFYGITKLLRCYS